MSGLFTWCRRLWLALGLRGRLVAGYTALFAVLLLGIALAETTVVRQVLIDDRKAALPATTNNLTSFLAQPVAAVPGVSGGQVRIGGQASGPGFKLALPVVAGNNDVVLALLDASGALLSRTAGADVQNVDPRQLLDAHVLSADANTPTIYERTVGGTSYLVLVRTIFTMLQIQSSQGSITGPAPGNLQPGSVTIMGVATTSPVSASPVTMLVAESLRPVDDTVHSLLLITLAASALGLLLAGTIGLAVARQALRPLERMTATAQAIAAGGDGALDRRLRLPTQGDEVGRLATMFDQMLDRIQATIAERLRSETRLRHFAADASHELRTPLAAMSGYTEVLLLGGKDNPALAEYVLHRMQGETARMSRLVGDLLTLARLEAGLPLHIQALDVAPLLEGWAEETRLLAARLGRDLRIVSGPQSEGDAGLTLLADPDRLHQILLNLLHNAVKFTPDGGLITVSVAQQNGHVAISVTDTGPGIATAELPFLFERFYRGDRARARSDAADAGGTGLGLAIAQGLAQTQGGHIDVTSTLGAGSAFTVILPAAPDAG